MTPAELYARHTFTIAQQPLDHLGSWSDPDQSHMPEIDWGVFNTWSSTRVDALPHFQVRIYREWNNGKCNWVCGSAWVFERDEWRPFMIFQHAGRHGESHRSRWVTDVQLYRTAVLYVYNVLTVLENRLNPTYTEPDAELGDALTHFAGASLDNFRPPMEYTGYV